MSRQQLGRSIRNSDPWMKDRLERYCTLHRRSPSAVRRPQLSRCRGTFLVLLGHSLGQWIAGIGNTVEKTLSGHSICNICALSNRHTTALKLYVGNLKPIAYVGV